MSTWNLYIRYSDTIHFGPAEHRNGEFEFILARFTLAILYILYNRRLQETKRRIGRLPVARCFKNLFLVGLNIEESKSVASYCKNRHRRVHGFFQERFSLCNVLLRSRVTEDVLQASMLVMSTAKGAGGRDVLWELIERSDSRRRAHTPPQIQLVLPPFP